MPERSPRLELVLTEIHPGIEVGQVLEQPRRSGDGHLGVTEFALARGRHAAAELLRHGLHAVTDPQHRHAELEHGRRRVRGIFSGHRLRATGEDDPARLEGAPTAASNGTPAIEAFCTSSKLARPLTSITESRIGVRKLNRA